MPSKKRPVVQLTSLLDLLFIMIFIALVVQPPPPVPPPPPPPIPEDETGPPPMEEDALDTLTEELAELEAENARYAAKNESISTAKEPREEDAYGEYRKLFIANVHYKHGATGYRYTESILYSADEHSGLYEYRINLAGAQVVKTWGEPLREADADRIKSCTEVVLTRDKIYQDCSMVFQRRKIIDCDRESAASYLCKEQLTWTSVARQERVGNWEYRLDLVKIYDPRLVM